MKARPKEGSEFRVPSSKFEGWLPHLFQATDSIFPTGSYAHSFGLEELVNLGLVRDSVTLEGFLKRQVLPSLEQLELPYLRFAFEAASRQDLTSLAALDLELDAIKVAFELRKASANIGRQRLEMLMEIAPHDLLRQFHDEIVAGRANGHHVVVCGLHSAAHDLPINAALTAYSYGALSSVVSASFKLIRVGQIVCHRTLAGALTMVPGAVTASLTVARDEAGWFNPLLDIASARHETTYTRLFIS